MDPKDRRSVEYWDDKTFVEWFESAHDEKQTKKKGKPKKKTPKVEKPLVRLLPFIEALRNNRYLQIRELYVWGVYLDYSDMLGLVKSSSDFFLIFKGGMVSKGNYELTYIELIDCFLNEKAIDALAPQVNYTKTLTNLILDFNEFGDSGCYTLCEGLKSCRWLIRLSVCFCGLHKQSGIWLGNLVAETSIRELYLDGNHLEAEGASALLTQLAEAAIQEGIERERLKAEKLAALEAKAKAGRQRIDFDAPPGASANNAEGVPDAAVYNNDESTNVNASGGELSGDAPKNPGPKRKKRKHRKRPSKKKKLKVPPSGPQISQLHMAENNINSISRGGSFAPVRCMQLLKAIIANAKDLQEVDIFGNDIGQVAGRIILEGILARKDNSLPRVGVRVTHLINQDTYDMIRKLAPPLKPKKRKAA
ncbi:unnamed protein product [Mesocestoides corti]|uniref:Uncharacterized protein n=1 Tax=Mesocestoides corti TaxID=53468 RepID=A0A158QUS4_MESCO|nr:unnamed protein product [Mesocestoides corti]